MLRLVEALVQSRLWKDNRGQDMVEYALMGGFITVVVAATFPPIGGGLVLIFSKMASMLAQAGT